MVKTRIELKEAIIALENKQREDLTLLKKEFITTTESLRPENILSTGINRIKHSTAFKTFLIVGGASIVSGIIVNKIASNRRKERHTQNSTFNNESPVYRQIKRSSRMVIQYILANLISQNSDVLINLASKLFNRRKENSSAQPVSPKPCCEK